MIFVEALTILEQNTEGRRRNHGRNYVGLRKYIRGNIQQFPRSKDEVYEESKPGSFLVPSIKFSELVLSIIYEEKIAWTGCN